MTVPVSFSPNALPPGILIWKGQKLQLSNGSKGLGMGDRCSCSWLLLHCECEAWQYCSHLFSLECDDYTGLDVLLMLLWLKRAEKTSGPSRDIMQRLGNNQSLEEVIKGCGEKGSSYSMLTPLLPPLVRYHLLNKTATLPLHSGPSWSTDNAEAQVTGTTSPL